MRIFLQSLFLIFLLVLMLSGCTGSYDTYVYVSASADEVYLYYDQNDNGDYNDYEAVNPDAAYQDSDAAADYIIEITEPDFGMQIQEIQFSRERFLGRTIRYEGMFMSSYWDGETIYFVARPEGGCCGFYGFEVYLNDIASFDDDTWVEVTGILEEFYVEGAYRYFLRLNLISLQEREEP